MRSKNIVSDAQVSPAGRTNVREIVIEIVQIKQYTYTCSAEIVLKHIHVQENN